MRIATLATLAALAGVPASAQDLKAWDPDANGVLDEAEFTEGFLEADIFERWDLDGDDLIGFSELAAGLYALWDANDDGKLSIEEWDDAVDLWFGEQAVNLSVDTWDPDGDGVISLAEFADGLQQSDLLARLDTANGDSLLGEEELATGLFDVIDIDADAVVREEEDGLLTEIMEFLVPDADADEVTVSEDIAADEEPVGDEEGVLEDGDEGVLEEDEALVVFDETFKQLPIPCGGDGGSCEEIAQRFCETLGYGEPIAFLDVQGSLYAIRCEDEI